MADGVKVVIDTNNVSRLHLIDATCELMDLVVDTYGDQGVGDLKQLALKTCCTSLPTTFSNHDISDTDVALFVAGYSGKCSLRRIMEDPADLRLLVCALKHPGSTLISCDKRLLMLADESKQAHTCFKAAIHKVDISVGGLFSDRSYNTLQMFDVHGDDPFFHYNRNTKCPVCDPSNTCRTKKTPPTPS